MSYDELLKKYQDSQIEIENLKLQVNNFKRIIYGVKREHTHKKEQLENCTQCFLFEVQEKIDEDLQPQVLENVEEVTVYKKKKNKESRDKKESFKRC